MTHLPDKDYVNILEMIMNEEIKNIYIKVFSLCKKVSELSSCKNNS